MRGKSRGSTRASRVIRARPKQTYAAFMDPAALVAWLPPGLRAEDNEVGSRISLEQLARRFE